MSDSFADLLSFKVQMRTRYLMFMFTNAFFAEGKVMKVVLSSFNTYFVTGAFFKVIKNKKYWIDQVFFYTGHFRKNRPGDEKNVCINIGKNG
jgi:hypothetical protein